MSPRYLVSRLLVYAYKFPFASFTHADTPLSRLFPPAKRSIFHENPRLTRDLPLDREADTLFPRGGLF